MKYSSNQKTILFIVFLIKAFLTGNINAQNFQVSPFISIPGDNCNPSITSPEYSALRKHYVCWENRLGQLYSIKLKAIDLSDVNIYTVWSDTIPNINPTVFSNPDSTIRIVWQSFRYDHWCLYSREFKDGNFGEVKLLTDTLRNSLNPTLFYNHLSWTDDGKLIYKPLDSGIIVLDSMGCSNPKINWFQSLKDPLILYEKGDNNFRQIRLIRHRMSVGPQNAFWEPFLISGEANCKNPAYFGGSIAYQENENGFWKIAYTYSYNPSGLISKTSNTACNFENPLLFKYPVPSGSASPQFPFFLVFDSDSIKGNNEIFIKYLMYSRLPEDSLIILSNASGDDIKPKIAYIYTSNYISDVCILWEHRENNKTDIWWAVSPFRIPLGNVDDGTLPNSYKLNQNYPNPFNPITTIMYTIPGLSKVELKVFDILGSEITRLVSKEQNAGTYKIEFDGSSLPSGMYIYTLQAGSFRDSKKLLLLK